MPTSEFAAKNKGLHWEQYAAAVDLPIGIDLIVGQPTFFTGTSTVTGASDIIALTALDTLKAYLAFQTIDAYAPIMTEKLEKMHFDFHETTLSGVTEQEPLWRRRYRRMQWIAWDAGRSALCREAFFRLRPRPR